MLVAHTRPGVRRSKKTSLRPPNAATTRSVPHDRLPGAGKVPRRVSSVDDILALMQSPHESASDPAAFAPAEGPPPERVLPFLRWALTGAGGLIAVATVWSVLIGITESMAAALLGRIVDAVGASTPDTLFARHLGLLVLGVVFFVLLRPLTFLLSGYTQMAKLEPRVFPLVLARLHRYTLAQSMRFFDSDFAGRIAQKQMQTARATTDAVTATIETAAFALAAVVSAVVYLAAVHPLAGLVLAGWLTAYIALIRAFLRRVRVVSADRAGARATVSGQVVDTLSNMRTVTLFAHSEHEDAVATEAMVDYQVRAVTYGKVFSLFRLTMNVLAGVLPVALIGSMLWLWSRGSASVGDLAAAGALGMRFAQMTGWVSFSLMSIFGNVGEIEDGLATLAKPLDLTDAPNAATLPPVQGEVRFENVSFHYGRVGGGGVRQLSLTIHPGEKVGLVGASGAGKSTLVSLLLRLHDAESGAVRVDGRDVREVSQASLRSQIGMVTQETAMFNRSARDNIAYGRPGASEGEIVEAARSAEAHDFILGLDDGRGGIGYDAYLGERGVTLSGGQRQRIALARAILKDAPILVLDEATSALDSEVEAAIQSALHRVMEGKTVLAIAHRLSTIAELDRIVVLDEGRIAEQCTHAELLARGGLYARFWDRQSGGFLGDQEVATGV